MVFKDIAQKMGALKLVTFDITNTVLRILGSVGHQYASVSKMYDVPADPEKLNQAFKEVWVEENTLYPNFGVSQGLSTYSWWSNVVKKCFRKAGYEESEQTLTQISGHLVKQFTTSQSWEIVDGSQEALMLIRNQGLKLGIVSNFDDRLEQILQNMALLHYFDFVLCSQVVGSEKPDPEIFRKALELGQCSAGEALHVGDNIKKDYLGARNVGIKSVLLCKDISSVPKTVDSEDVISNLTEISKFINK